MTDLPPIERAIALQPGDIVIATVTADVTPEQFARVRDALTDELPDIHVVVIAGVDVHAYRPIQEPR